MTHVVRICLAAALSLSLSAGAASAQTATGPALDGKPTAGEAAVAEAGRWSADATVARLVQDPIKILGMRRFTPEGRIALKGPMERAESAVRQVVARLSTGAIDEPGARRELAGAIAEYRIAVRRLMAAR